MKNWVVASLILVLVFSIFSLPVWAKKDSDSSKSEKEDKSPDSKSLHSKEKSSEEKSDSEKEEKKSKSESSKKEEEAKLDKDVLKPLESPDEKNSKKRKKEKEDKEKKSSEDQSKDASKEEKKKKKELEKELKLDEKHEVREIKKEEKRGESKEEVKEKKKKLKEKHKENKGLQNALAHVKNENAVEKIERNVVRLQNKETGQEELKTQIKKRIKAEKDYGLLVVIEDIPKSVATHISQVSFSEQPEVLEADPVVKWNFNNVPAGKEVDVSYVVNGEAPAVSESIVGGEDPGFFGKIAIWLKRVFA